MVPDRNPRTECGCHPVAFISSLAVAPPGRFSRSRTLAALLPSRAEPAFFSPLGAFLAEVAFFPDFAFFGATCARRAPAGGFFVAFASAAALAGAVSVSVFAIMFLLGGDYRGDDMNRSGWEKKQGNSAHRGRRRWNGDGRQARHAYGAVYD